MKTRLIIFSSKEALPIAEAIQKNLFHKEFTVTVWTNGFFELSQSYISSFSDIRTDYDYAIVLCNDDDIIRVRGKVKYVPRDNVILELGMSIAAFSINHVIIVKKDNVTLPTDLEGIQPVNYSIEENENLDSVAGMICSNITSYISKQHAMEYIKLPWDEYFYHVRNMVSKLKQSSRLGGFYFDIIVGINGGGLMVADIISREYDQIKPVLSLYADRRTKKTSFDSDDLIFKNSDIIKILENDRIKNILLMDSFTRDGVTVIEAKKYLKKHLSSKLIKSAVIYANEKLKGNKILEDIDYISTFKELDNKKLSVDNF